MMTLKTRATPLVILLGAGWVCQCALQHHVASAEARIPRDPAVTVSDIPVVLRDWRGEDRPCDDPQPPAGQRIRRVYRHGPAGLSVEVFVAASSDGSDRYHHPEICRTMAGQQEDRASRASLELPGHPCPVQQYRFGSGGEFQLVYYWHYTLVPPPDDGRDAVQRLYDRLHRRPPSVTVQVSLPEQSSADRQYAHEFVSLFDAALREQLPDNARRGRQSAPVIVTN
jgi:hypothetical protein